MFPPSRASSSEQVFYSVHVEAEREPQCLVERIALRRGYKIGGIEREHAHLEARADREILTVALVLSLMVIACTQGELVVIHIFAAHTPVYLLQLFLKTARRIAETLEYTTYAAHVVIVALDTLLIVFRRLTVVLLGIGRHEKLVGVSRDGEAVILVHRHHERPMFDMFSPRPI